MGALRGGTATGAGSGWALAVDQQNLELGRKGFGQSTEAALCRAPGTAPCPGHGRPG